jgi:hypothetical protein
LNPEITALQARIDAARLAQARAAATKEREEEAKAAALQALKDEFGIDNAEDVRARLEQLRSQVQDELAQVNKILTEIE